MPTKNAFPVERFAMSDSKIDSINILVAAFGISSVGGLAALLRSNKKLTFRSVMSTVLYSGMSGLLIALVWYNYFNEQGNIYFLLGVSGLAGIGGTTIIDFILLVVKNGGVNIRINTGSKDEDN